MITKKHLDTLSSDDLLRLQVRYDVTQSYEKVAQKFNISQTDVKKALNTVDSDPSRAEAAELVRQWVRLGVKAGQKNDLVGVNAVVTPEIAQALLALNTDNRNINRKAVEFFEESMQDGRFYPMGSGPVMSRTGILNDGQHKLQAVVDSGISAKMFLHFGESDEARFVHDSGGAGKRTAAQALRIAYGSSLPNTSIVATAARFILSGLLGDEPDNRKLGHDKYVWCIRGIKEKMTFSAGASHRVYRRTRASAAALAAVHFYISDGTKHADRLNDFWEKLASPTELSADDPRYVLQAWMIQKGFRRSKGKVVLHNDAAARLLMGTVVRAWNKFISGESVKNIAWNPETPFPRPL